MAEHDDAIQIRDAALPAEQVTIFAPSGRIRANLDYDGGHLRAGSLDAEAADDHRRAALDLQKESYDPTVIGPTLYLPNRATQTIPGADVVAWKDVNPRFGVAYDVFGNGKTAVKASAARGVARESIATVAALTPAVSLITSTAGR